MSLGRDDEPGIHERTMLVDLRQMKPSKPWKPFKFRNLERVLVTVPAELEVAAVVWARAVVITETALPLVEVKAGKEASA